jgi:hypothetical protein
MSISDELKCAEKIANKRLKLPRPSKKIVVGIHSFKCSKCNHATTYLIRKVSAPIDKGWNC